MYDVVIVGARVAGAATARLLAEQGVKVLVVDRVMFPSETISSHQVQLPGGAMLRRWGLLDRLTAAGTPPTRTIRFDPGSAVLQGRFQTYDGVDALYSPRRTLLDPMLIDAARTVGAEVREGFHVEEIVARNGRVEGIRGRHRSGGPLITELARLVVGADGKRSFVASAVRAKTTRESPASTVAYYAYWEGLTVAGGEIYERPRRSVGVWPTNNGLVVTFLSAPAADAAVFRTDALGSALDTFDRMGDLGERVRAGRLVGRFVGTTDVPNFVRKPYGPGWALVGDAGLTMDPITGQGISQGLLDADLLATAIVEGLGGTRPIDVGLHAYERARNRRAIPIFKFTTLLARHDPQPYEQAVLFRALERQPDEVSRLLSVFAGVTTFNAYTSPANMLRILGWRALVDILVTKLGLRQPRLAESQS